MAKIDLSKIKAFTAPSKTIKVFIAGEFQEFEIFTISDLNMMKIMQLDITKDQVKIIESMLCEILNISAEDATMIISKDFNAALEIFNSGKELTEEWMRKRNEERETAKKNLKTTNQTNI